MASTYLQCFKITCKCATCIHECYKCQVDGGDCVTGVKECINYEKLDYIKYNDIYFDYAKLPSRYDYESMSKGELYGELF